MGTINYEEAKRELKEILSQFTEEFVLKNEVEFARHTYPHSTIPYTKEPERWRKLNYCDVERGGYRVSSWGRVFDNESMDFVQTYLDEKGYVSTSLRKCEEGSKFSKERSTIRVHRLIAHAFVDNPENKDTVNHINLDKRNNTIQNLEWTTNLENLQHGVDNGANIGKGGHKYFTIEQVNEIKELHKNGVTFTDIAKLYNRKPLSISELIRGKTYNDDFWGKMNM
jgi:hypothetical protein